MKDLLPTTDFLVPWGGYSNRMNPGECCTGGPEGYLEEFGHEYAHHSQVMMKGPSGHVWVDFGVAWIVRRLWHLGVPTTGSCQGGAYLGNKPPKDGGYIGFPYIEEYLDIVEREVPGALGLDSYRIDRRPFLKTNGIHESSIYWEVSG